MKKIIICLIMALLVVGSADAQKKTRKKTSGKARTTATTKASPQQPVINGETKWKDKAEAGDAEAQYQLAAYLDRAGRYDEALKWFLKAAEQDFPMAFFKLGWRVRIQESPVYERMGITADSLYNKAHKLALPLAKNGNAWGQLVMGYLYEFGAGGLAKNHEEAFKWFLKSAEQGNAEAQERVGCYYYYGLGIAKNKEEGVKWYRKAAEQGDPDAQCVIGDFYMQGDGGFAKNEKEGLKWYRKAAANEQQDAKVKIVKLGKNAKENKKYDKFYGTWTSARGTTFTITPGPYLNLSGAGKFSGEWTSNGELYVSFGYPDEIHLRYNKGYLYDRNGRMYWRIGD